MIDEEAVNELFEVVEDMLTVQYFPMVLNGSKGGSKRSVILSPISKPILISSNYSRIPYKTSKPIHNSQLMLYSGWKGMVK